MNLGRKQVWSLIWGTIGSVLAPGSILDRRRSRFPDSGSGKSGNPEKCHVTYQIKALFKLVDMDKKTGIWIADPENPENWENSIYIKKHKSHAAEGRSRRVVLMSIFSASGLDRITNLFKL